MPREPRRSAREERSRIERQKRPLKKSLTRLRPRSLLTRKPRDREKLLPPPKLLRPNDSRRKKLNRPDSLSKPDSRRSLDSRLSTKLKPPKRPPSSLPTKRSRERLRNN